MVKYVKENFYYETIEMVMRMINLINKRNVIDILYQSDIEGLSENKKLLILNFLLSKIEMMRRIYFGKEDDNVSKEWKRLSISDLER